MKRKSIILTILFILIISSLGYASNEKIQISRNGQNFTVTKAPIEFNGELINEKISSYVRDGRTLVHVRFLEEYLDAKVSWLGASREVVVELEDQKITLGIDSLVAKKQDKKNGNALETIFLDNASIPRLVRYGDKADSMTMVPLSFLAKAFGYEVDWDAEKGRPYVNSEIAVPEPEPEPEPEVKPEPVPPVEEDKLAFNNITDIEISTGSTKKNKLIVKSDKELSYSVKKAENNKVIIDITGSRLNLKNTLDKTGSINVDDEYIKTVKYSQESQNPYISRIEIDLKKYEEPNIITRSDGTGLNISFGTQKVGDIYRDKIGENDVIVVKGAKEEDMKIMKLENPSRLVLDLLDSSLDGRKIDSYQMNIGFIERLRVSQFSVDKNYSISDKIVRLVLDVKGRVDNPNIKIESYEDGIIIYPEKSLWEDIKLEEDGRTQFLTIKNLKPSNYTSQYDTATKNLKISIDAKDTEISDGLIIVKNHLIDEIEVEEINGRKEISIRFIRSIVYENLSNPSDKDIKLKIERNRDLKPEDRLIVIDAGHGGKDSGAVSITGRKEKDFNLILSKKFNAELKKLGYNTIMTRDDDTFIDLYERPRIANENYADLFISIHANSTGSNNSAINGVEMLYAPRGTSQVKEGDQYPFAKLMLDEVVKATGAHNRGVVQRPRLVVLRETKMPAVLVEAGFLSNAKEEKLLFTESYQDIIVEAMVNAVEIYFDMY